MFRFLSVLLGGVAMGLTVAPVSWWPLAWLAVVPLWINVSTGAESLKKVALAAFIWGFAYHGQALFWITGIHPMTWMGVPWAASLAIALFCWLFITLWGTTIVLGWSFGMFLTRKYPPVCRLLIGVALWCALESLWSRSPLWWTTVAYTQSPHNLLILQWGKLSGFTTVTAIIILINGLIAEIGALTVRSRQYIKLCPIPVICLILFHVWGWLSFTSPVETPPEKAVNIGVIQGNIPNTIKLYPEGFRKAIEGYTIGYKLLSDAGADAILTPETALPYYWENLVSNSSIYRAIEEKKTPLWLGAFGSVKGGYTNGLFTIDGEGKVISRYDKVILVPLGEYVPFQEILGGIVSRLSPLEARLIAGNPEQVIETPFGRAIVGICYESAFGEHFRRQAAAGGEFIITASNNAHYSHAMPAQHHAQDVMRAIELDRWMARATNTGYSAFVDPRGRTLWISDMDSYRLHRETIYKRGTLTPYARHGDRLTKLLSVLGALSIVFYRKT